MNVPEMAKDTMVAILGAAVGFAGLLLIFSGFLFAQAGSFPPESTDDATIDRYRNAGKWGLLPFFTALTVAALSFAWMVHPSPCVYWSAILVFGFLSPADAACGAQPGN
jgi:hypothetical protein